MTQKFNATFKSTVLVLTLILFAIFPISNTIALRNVLLLLLVSSMLLAMVFTPIVFEYPLRQSLRRMPWPILFWVSFLMLFPVWAPETSSAWQNLGGQWSEALLAGFVGYGAYHLLGRKGPGLLALGFASAAPLSLHLFLSIGAMQGLLNDDFYAAPTIATLWQSLCHPESFQTNPHWTLSNLMNGFRGIEPMHGNLGYPACQSICLFCASFIQALRTRNIFNRAASLLGIALCFLSILIAQSRGAILYAFLIMAVSFALSKVRSVSGFGLPVASHKAGVGWRGKVIGLVALLLLLSITFQYIKRDARWYSMADSVEAAYSIQNPTRVLCDGLNSSIQDDIRTRLADRDPKYVQSVINGLSSDGGRILILRAGFQLMLENPLGLDGSRQSYRKLIKEKCGHEPIMQFAHSHNSWVDLSLALGWGGLMAFACLMMFFLYRGATGMRSNVEQHWSMALVLISTFWILRGFADSVYREHYLQMQFILLMYLLAHRQFVIGAIKPNGRTTNA